MNVRLWGTRGSLATPGADMARYGGNTSCVAVQGADGNVLVLDAGTGVRRLGMSLPREVRRVDILLTHLHMDHIQGSGILRPAIQPGDGSSPVGTCKHDVELEGPPDALLVPAALPGAAE